MYALVIVLCLSLGSTAGQIHMETTWAEIESEHQQFLYDLVEKVNNEYFLDTVLLLQHRHNRGCLLRKWNSPKWPVLRFNEFTRINVSTNINRRVVAVICMTRDDDNILFNILASSLNGLRMARIIVWLHTENIVHFQRKISKHAEQYQFSNIAIVLEKRNSLVIYRMFPFPHPTFQELTNWKSNRIFLHHSYNFQGKEATIMPSLVPPNSFISTNPRTGEKYLNGFMQDLLNSFAAIHNISLKLMRPLNVSDVIHTPQAIEAMTNGTLDFMVNAYPRTRSLDWPGVESTFYLGIISLYIVAPCEQKLHMDQVIEQIFPGIYFYVILTFYIVFCVLDSLSQAITNYRLGYGLKLSLKDIINGRITRGFLGQPMPIRYHSSPSMRQVMLLTSFIGIILCSWMNANLSTLLTKHPPCRHIETYDQLRESKLPVLFGYVTRTIVEWEYGDKFFERNIPNVQFKSSKELSDLLFDFNTSYAYQAYSHVWDVVQMYQMYTKDIRFCRADNILITKDLPLTVFLQKNSIYAPAMSRFIRSSQSSGINQMWLRKAYNDLLREKLMRRGKRSPIDPLDMINMKWMWDLLIFGNLLGFLCFLAELGINRWHRMRRAEI